MKIIKHDLFNSFDFIDYGFFNRIGGESVGEFAELNVGFWCGDHEEVVIRNRAKITQYFGLDVSCLVILRQENGDVVHVIDKNNIEKYKFRTSHEVGKNIGDGIITDQSGLMIAVATADCLSILLVDSEKRYIGVIHAGWRGVVGCIIENVLQKMQSLGCQNIYAIIGPCLQVKSFEIGEDIARLIDEKYVKIEHDKYFFDMSGFALKKLLDCGVKCAVKLDIDTFSNIDFFSHRRQGEVFGAQCSGIMIRGENNE